MLDRSISVRGPPGFLYQAHLRAEVRDRLGWQWGPVANGAAELTHVAPGVLSEFSRRRHEITSAAELVDAGVLEARDEHSAAFERGQQRFVDAITAGADRGHIRAYATWHVAHPNSRTPAHTGARPRRLRSMLAA